MKRLFIKKFITSMIFITFLFTFSFFNILVTYNPLKQYLKKENFKFNNIKQTIQSIEYTINENVFEKYNFINFYGYIQKLLYKNEESNFEVIRDTKGSLHYTYFTNKPNDVDKIVSRMEKLNIKLKNTNKKLVYLMTPSKYVKGYTEFPKGIPYNYENETADNFILELKNKKIDSIDLRENLTRNDIPYNKLFFKTDHHWTLDTAFWGFTEFVSQLNSKYNLNLDPYNFFTKKENYNFINYTDTYIGSMARKTGIYYSGVDDFTLIYPKFKTDYTFFADTNINKIDLYGRFEDALLTVYPLRADKGNYSLETDKYFSYLYGNQAFVHVDNKDNENGPNVLFVKDSLCVPLSAFFSTVCNNIYLIDPRYYKEDIYEFIDNTDLDFIFVSFYPQNLTEEFFKLF